MSALRKVLVVDDDPVVGRSFNRVLSQKGYVVITAENGPDALAKMQEGDFDVVFTDIKMPGMDGLEVAEKVKARKPWTPVVIVTGYGSKENEARAREVGVSAFAHKPLSPEMIEGLASNALLATAAPIAAASAIAAPLPPDAVEVPAVKAPTALGFLKNVGLFFSAPFIGLAYVAFAPVVVAMMLARAGAKAAMARGWVQDAVLLTKKTGLLIAAPFIGLAYFAAAPFLGVAMIVRAILQPKNKELAE